FGIFVTLAETGADGLVPLVRLPSDFYRHEEKRQRLVGQRWGRVFTMGDKVTVRLAEADTTTGSLVFDLVDGDESESQDRRRARAEAPRQRRSGGGRRRRAG